LSTLYERLEIAINDYETNIVKRQISSTRNLVILGAFYYIALFGLAIITNLVPNINTLIGTLGLGGLGFGASAKQIGSAVKKWVIDRGILLESVEHLKIKLRLCGKDNQPCLLDLQKSYLDLIKKFNENLEQKFEAYFPKEPADTRG
jgi:hypothetical protein